MPSAVYKYIHPATNLTISNGLTLPFSLISGTAPPASMAKIDSVSIHFAVLRSADNIAPTAADKYIRIYRSNGGVLVYGYLLDFFTAANTYYQDATAITVWSENLELSTWYNFDSLYMTGTLYTGTIRPGGDITVTINWSQTTTAASPLASLAVSSTLAETNVTLSGSGAASGVGNAINGYEIEYRESSNGSTWSAWAALVIISSTSSSLSVSVAPPGTRGYYRQFRVRTRGTAGSDYYSVWKESTNNVRMNRVPNAPTVVNASPALFETGNVTISWGGASDPDADRGDYIASHRLFIAWSGGASASGWSDWQLLWEGAGTLTYSHSPSISRGFYVKYMVIAVDSFSVSSSGTESNVLRRNSAPVAPASLSVSPLIYESGGILLTWPAGSDPDGNLARYYLEYATSSNGSSWGSWVAWTNTTTLSATHSPSLERGYYIKYRIYAMDSLSVISGYRESASVRRNRLPLTPTIGVPASGGTTYNQRPVIIATVGAEPDGQTQNLQVSIDGGGYVNMGAVAASGGTISYTLTAALSIGNHTLSVRAVDALGAAGNTAAVTITVASPAWARSIGAGTVIANATISHRADINEMLTRTNTVRAFYNLSAVTLSGVGEWASWRSNMQALQAAIGEIYTATGRNSPAWSTVPAYPTANIVNQIRTSLLEA